MAIGRRVTRRNFLGLTARAAAAGVAARATILEPAWLHAQTSAPVAPSDRVRFAAIGTGTRGCDLLEASQHIPGAECVAICDLYQARHQAGQEALGHSVPVTGRYQELLDRKDVDAVLIAVPDHQHRRIVADACAAGKDVYCEKPMSHTVEDGFAMIAAAEKGNRMLQIGSQRVSSILYAKAREIVAAGKLGQLTLVDASWGRNSASGAWVYPIPPGASESNIDWKTFLEDAPQRPFDPVRFFRWRCFDDYGEGLAGDLFVHLLSGMQVITGVNTFPTRAYSTGGLFRFKDGRDFPDLIQTLYDYPDFRVSVHCNLNNDSGEHLAFYGTKGTLVIQDGTLTYTPQDDSPQAENYSIGGWPKNLRDEYNEEWQREHPPAGPLASMLAETAESYTVPAHYNDTVDHEANFFASVRSRKAPVEDGHFGNHTAVGCHMANASYFKREAVSWDAAKRGIRTT
jgi:predicted dehydrogenase